jgi:hypothetical protein
VDRLRWRQACPPDAVSLYPAHARPSAIETVDSSRVAFGLGRARYLPRTVSVTAVLLRVFPSTRNALLTAHCSLLTAQCRGRARRKRPFRLGTRTNPPRDSPLTTKEGQSIGFHRHLVLQICRMSHNCEYLMLQRERRRFGDRVPPNVISAYV